MRILIFNWKDIKNPEAGGAEVFTHEIAKRWVRGGHEVTLFCRSFEAASERDEIDGVTIIRRGGRFTVYREARRWYRREGRGHFDVVIDEVNTRPFFAPKYVRDVPVLALIHQLAREIWHYEFPAPVAWLGQFVLEPLWLRAYRDIEVLAVSESTRKDLVSLGLRRVTVVPEGLNIPPDLAVPPKEREPTLIFVGRLARNKRPDHAIAAFEIVRQRFPQAKLWIVGSGYLEQELSADSSEGVIFLGKVTQLEKFDVLARAHILVAPSVREGWGLTVTEAGAVGTPAVGYNVPGLRDSIKDWETGMLVAEHPTELAQACVRLLVDQDLADRLGEGARRFSQSLDWSISAKTVLRHLALAVDATEKQREIDPAPHASVRTGSEEPRLSETAKKLGRSIYISIGGWRAPLVPVVFALIVLALAWQRGGPIGLIVVVVAVFNWLGKRNERELVVLGLACLVMTAILSGIALNAPAEDLAAAAFGFLLLGTLLGIIRTVDARKASGAVPETRPGPDEG